MATQLLLIAAFVTSMIIMSLNYKKRKKRVMFISGASIEKALIAGSHFYQLHEILKKENVDDKYELLKAGIRSGNIHEVFEKIEVEVLDGGPDIVIINFAITDMMDWMLADKKEFDAFFKSILKRLADAKIDIIICLPSITSEEEDCLNLRGIDGSRYVQLMKDVAVRNALPVIDMQVVLDVPNVGANADKKFAREIWNALKII